MPVCEYNFNLYNYVVSASYIVAATSIAILIVVCTVGIIVNEFCIYIDIAIFNINDGLLVE